MTPPLFDRLLQAVNTGGGVGISARLIIDKFDCSSGTPGRLGRGSGQARGRENRKGERDNVAQLHVGGGMGSVDRQMRTSNKRLEIFIGGSERGLTFESKVNSAPRRKILFYIPSV